MRTSPCAPRVSKIFIGLLRSVCGYRYIYISYYYALAVSVWPIDNLTVHNFRHCRYDLWKDFLRNRSRVPISQMARMLTNQRKLLYRALRNICNSMHDCSMYDPALPARYDRGAYGYYRASDFYWLFFRYSSIRSFLRSRAL